MQGLDGKIAAGEVAEEADLGLPAQAGAEKVCDLGDDKGGDDKRPRMGLQ